MTLILLAGFALRLFHLNTPALRGDEAFTVLHWMREPLTQTLATLATTDPQPPLAYALFRAYSLIAGSDELVVRLLPALLNMFGIPALYGIGRRIGGARTGLIAAALFAASPALLWHAQDARSYGIWAAFSALSLWLALRALDHNRKRDWALFVAVQLAAVYLYYLELLFLGALTVYVLLTLRGRSQVVRRWLLSLLVIGAAFLPAVALLLSGPAYPGTAGGFDPARLLTDFLPTLTYGAAIPAGRESIFTALALVVPLVGWVLLWRARRDMALLLGLYILVPLAALSIVALRLNVFVPRYVLAASVALIVLAAVVIERGLSTHNRSVPLRLLAIGHVALIAWSLSGYYFDYTKSPDWRGMAAYLAPRTAANDLLVNAAADIALTFYLQERAIPGELAYMPANPGQSAREIEGTLSAAFDAGDAVWMIGQPPPAWPNTRTPDDWLAAHGLNVRGVNLGGLRIQEFLPDQTLPGAAEGLDFGGVVQVTGAKASLPLEPDGSLPVVIDFTVLGPSEIPLKMFVHVLGPVNPATGTPLWAQDDQVPRDTLDTTVWQAGFTFRDVFVLPGLNTLPAGEYTIVTGWYDPVTGARLLSGDADSISLFTLTVSENGMLSLTAL